MYNYVHKWTFLNQKRKNKSHIPINLLFIQYSVIIFLCQCVCRIFPSLCGFLVQCQKGKRKVPSTHCQHFSLTLTTCVHMSKCRQNKRRERETTSAPPGTMAATCSYRQTVRGSAMHAAQRVPPPHDYARSGSNDTPSGCSGGP